MLSKSPTQVAAPGRRAVCPDDFRGCRLQASYGRGPGELNVCPGCCCEIFLLRAGKGVSV